MKIFNQNLADIENARRFWSIFEFAFTPRGVPNMFKSVPHIGSKFLNPFTDFLPWWKYDFTPLKNYLCKFVDFPIKTRLEEGQPRLLLTSVDIQDFSSTVVFDSYEKLHDAPIKNNRLEDKSLDKITNNGNTNLEKEDNSKNVKKGSRILGFHSDDYQDKILVYFENDKTEEKEVRTFCFLEDGDNISNPDEYRYLGTRDRALDIFLKY